jgi:catechol 2,3-dioxygenase-like lactoylglutathione lyase family enzyme
MARIEHVTVGVRDLAASRAFYEAALVAVGLDQTLESPGQVFFGDGRSWRFVISSRYTTGAPVHVAFGAETVEQVQAFHERGLAAGGRDNGAPGPRPQYSDSYYAAFLLDPDGHNIEALTRI